MEEVLEYSPEENIISLIERNDIDAVEKLLNDGHQLTVDELALAYSYAMVDLLILYFECDVDSITRLAELQREDVIKNMELSADLVVECIEQAVKSCDLVYLNSIQGKSNTDINFSKLYSDLITECSQSDNWLDSDFIPKLRMLARLVSASNFVPKTFGSKKIRELHRLVQMMAEHFAHYPVMTNHEVLTNPTFLTIERLFYHYIISHRNDFFKPKDNIRWIASQLKKLTRLLNSSVPSNDIYEQDRQERKFLKQFLSDEKAKTIVLDDVPLSRYFPALFVLLLCDIDPSKLNIKKSYFELNWSIFVESYFDEENADVRKALVKKLKYTLNTNNDEQLSINQPALGTLLAYISQANRNRHKQMERSLPEFLGRDPFGMIIKHLIDDGDMTSVARARRASKSWQQAIDNMPVWGVMLKEIGGALRRLEKHTKVEHFRPAAKYVLQCYGFIIKNVTNKTVYVNRLWGILTNNTPLALRNKSFIFNYENVFKASDLSIACAYGRFEIVEVLIDHPILPHPNQHSLHGNGPGRYPGRVNGWPLDKMMEFSNDPFQKQ